MKHCWRHQQPHQKDLGPQGLRQGLRRGEDTRHSYPQAQIIKSTAIATGFSIGVIQRLLVEKRGLRRSTLSNPVLIEENELPRVAYALSFVKRDLQSVGKVEGHPFDSMFDMVHVNEK
uniref:AlNc14C31G2863 protein n=1 Tax=Albugo laibachii Nc14 TaxID=890382 RepID=F0W7Q9_9STRA|nr:AlNc14C31G2863 [Albugo laibachii Nc14]|eukprot:CCA17161.1 AlNc14C31G2863 [Albugo laibachii Nc14]